MGLCDEKTHKITFYVFCGLLLLFGLAKMVIPNSGNAIVNMILGGATALACCIGLAGVLFEKEKLLIGYMVVVGFLWLIAACMLIVHFFEKEGLAIAMSVLYNIFLGIAEVDGVLIWMFIKDNNNNFY